MDGSAGHCSIRRVVCLVVSNKDRAARAPLVNVYLSRAQGGAAAEYDVQRQPGLSNARPSGSAEEIARSPFASRIVTRRGLAKSS